MDYPDQGRMTPRRPVRILSIRKNSVAIVRFLGDIQGCILHWTGKITWPCGGKEDCPATLHKMKTLWKGFAAAEYWSEDDQSWWPAVLEVTEALEEEMADLKMRCTVWTLSHPQPTKKQTPVLGKYEERSKEEHTAPEFPILPVLERVYHGAKIILGTPNPVPRKIVLGANNSPPPLNSQRKSKAPQREATPEEHAAFMKKLREVHSYPERNEGNGKAHANGTH